MQNQNCTAILSGPQASAGSFSVVPENFERAMVLHTVRKLPKLRWDNNRDQFYQPTDDNLPLEFISDCVVWSAFATSNNTVSLKNISYQGKNYQIDNQMFPFMLSEVSHWKCSLPDIRAQLISANEDRFLAKWLDSAQLSEDALLVINAARALYKCVYANLHTIRWLDYKIQLWDLGWWQIKEAAKQIEVAQPLYEDLRNTERALGAKLHAQIASYGFMAPDKQDLD